MKRDFIFFKNELSLLFFFINSITFNCQSQTIIDGYTNKQSYRAGENIEFYIKGTNNSNNHILRFVNISNNSSIDINIANLDLSQTTTNVESWKNGFGYSKKLDWIVPSTLKSGIYRLYGLDNILQANYKNITVIIKGSINSDIVVVIPTNTINAYTTSGGKSLYLSTENDCSSNSGSNSQCVNSIRATTVSFYRPQYFDFIPIDGFLNWLETNSNIYNSVNFIADIDLENNLEISSSKLIIITGHSEYWTRQARLNFDSFVDGGKNALVLSGNSMWWQARYEDNNYNLDYTKLTCYKSDSQLYSPNCNCNYPLQPYDLNCNELLKTINWNNPKLKYSILGSIGADISLGGFGLVEDCNYGGFDGFEVSAPSSPILSGTGYTQGQKILFANHEYDGSVMKNLDSNNNVIGGGQPIIDASALGFYRAEMIAYNKTKLPNEFTNGNYNYIPILAFQKTCSSGKVINVNSDSWCSNFVMGGNTFTRSCTDANNNITSKSVIPDFQKIKLITKNMIDLLLTNSNIFLQSIPNEFLITPATKNVSYTACTNGFIKITPCGVTINNGYKFDQINGNIAKIENCISCNSSGKIIKENTNNIKPNNFEVESIRIFPNPSNGIFNISFFENSSGSISIFNSLGFNIYQSNFNNIKDKEIDIQNKSNGIYFLNIKIEDTVINYKIIKE